MEQNVVDSYTQEDWDDFADAIDGMSDLAHNFAAEKGFWGDERNVGELLMLTVSELGEALEAHRKDERCDTGTLRKVWVAPRDSVWATRFKGSVKDTFEDEIADTFIRLLDLAGGLGLHLGKHVAMKLQYNATRDRLHGKKY